MWPARPVSESPWSTASCGAAAHATGSEPNVYAGIRAARLFVFDPGFAWLTLETIVTILDGPDAPRLNVRLFRIMQGKGTGPLTLEWPRPRRT